MGSSLIPPTHPRSSCPQELGLRSLAASDPASAQIRLGRRKANPNRCGCLLLDTRHHPPRHPGTQESPRPAPPVVSTPTSTPSVSLGRSCGTCSSARGGRKEGGGGAEREGQWACAAWARHGGVGLPKQHRAERGTNTGNSIHRTYARSHCRAYTQDFFQNADKTTHPCGPQRPSALSHGERRRGNLGQWPHHCGEVGLLAVRLRTARRAAAVEERLDCEVTYPMPLSKINPLSKAPPRTRDRTYACIASVHRTHASHVEGGFVRVHLVEREGRGVVRGHGEVEAEHAGLLGQAVRGVRDEEVPVHGYPPGIEMNECRGLPRPQTAAARNPLSPASPSQKTTRRAATSGASSTPPLLNAPERCGVLRLGGDHRVEHEKLF